MHLCTYVFQYLCTYLPLYLCSSVPLYLCTAIPTPLPLHRYPELCCYCELHLQNLYSVLQLGLVRAVVADH
jgi:hypothetical protein